MVISTSSTHTCSKFPPASNERLLSKRNLKYCVKAFGFDAIVSVKLPSCQTSSSAPPMLPFGSKVKSGLLGPELAFCTPE